MSVTFILLHVFADLKKYMATKFQIIEIDQSAEHGQCSRRSCSSDETTQRNPPLLSGRFQICRLLTCLGCAGPYVLAKGSIAHKINLIVDNLERRSRIKGCHQ